MNTEMKQKFNKIMIVIFIISTIIYFTYKYIPEWLFDYMSLMLFIMLASGIATFFLLMAIESDKQQLQKERNDNVK